MMNSTTEPSRRIRWFSMMAVVAALLGTVATPALAAAPSSVTIVAQGTLEATGADSFHLDGVGVGTRIGGFAYRGDVVVEAVSPAGLITDTLTETLDMPGGGSITILCQQVATPVSPGVYEGTDVWTVIGGTGTWAGATGSGTGTTTVDLNTGTFAKVFVGNISR